MKIKIVEVGWEGYTGPLGNVWFEGAVSVDDVPPHLIARIGAQLKVVDAATGKQIGAGQDAVEMTAVEMGVAEPLDRGIGFVEEAPAPVEAQPEPEWVTREQLETIADEKGIKGLREVAEPLGVRGKAIAELIDEILRKQEEMKKALAGERLARDAS